MFGVNKDFVPMTYSIRGYKKRKSFNVRKFAFYLAAITVSLLAIGVAFLSASKII
ncbi:MAG TPA: hypothetical protein VF941_18315 [Clostridia bacterium]